MEYAGRETRPLQYLGKLSASYKQVDVLVDILDKQLIFQLIYPKIIYCVLSKAENGGTISRAEGLG